MKCRLCLETRDLRRSHIYSELLYKPLYGDDQAAITMQRGVPYIRKLRKGLRERLLCDDCEQRLRKYEDYFAKAWYQNSPLPVRIPPVGTLKAPAFDYAPFRLFHLAQLWRASVSTLGDYSAIRLGPHEERIRQMLLSEDVGDAESYPLRAAVIVRAATSEVAHKLFAPHVPTREGGTRAYTAIYGGCAWRTLVASAIPPQLMYFDRGKEFILSIVTLEALKAVNEITKPFLRDGR